MSEPTKLKLVKPQTPEQREMRQTMDVMVVTPAIVNSWVIPPFQRQLKENSKVVTLATDIQEDGGVIPGVVTLGVMDGVHYLIDGQHRRHAFILSECEEGLANVRVCYFKSMSEMGEEFVKANSQLARMTPDDLIRGMEGTSEPLVALRKACPWLGYSQIRRGENSPTASMSSTLRCWFGSAQEAPVVGSLSAFAVVETLTMEEANTLKDFLKLAMTAWGKDKEYARLWGNLNLCLCMWLYRRTVMSQHSPRTVRMDKQQFTECLMALSADKIYIAWLVGRQLRDSDRSPAYRRIREIFGQRIESTTDKKPIFPSPVWYSASGGRK